MAPTKTDKKKHILCHPPLFRRDRLKIQCRQYNPLILTFLPTWSGNLGSLNTLFFNQVQEDGTIGQSRNKWILHVNRQNKSVRPKCTLLMNLLYTDTIRWVGRPTLPTDASKFGSTTDANLIFKRNWRSLRRTFVKRCCQFMKLDVTLYYFGVGFWVSPTRYRW